MRHIAAILIVVGLLALALLTPPRPARADICLACDATPVVHPHGSQWNGPHRDELVWG